MTLLCEEARPDRGPELPDDSLIVEHTIVSLDKRTFDFRPTIIIEGATTNVGPTNEMPFEGNEFVIISPPLAGVPVNITVDSISQLQLPTSFCAVWLNRHLSDPSTRVFLGDYYINGSGKNCVLGTPFLISTDVATITADVWNQSIIDANNAGGHPTITVECIGTPLPLVCTGGGLNARSRVTIQYTEGDRVFTPVNARLWTEDLRTKMVFKKTDSIPLGTHQDQVRLISPNWRPGYAMHYSARPCRRVESLDELEPTKWFYATRVVNKDGYARLMYRSAPVSLNDGNDPEYIQTHFARAFQQDFDPSTTPPPVYGEPIKDVVDKGYCARLGVFHAPYWGEAIYQVAGTICGGII